MKKLIRITTVPSSLRILLHGQPKYMEKNGFDVVLASSEGKDNKIITEETGLQVKVLPLTRTISPFTDLKALWITYKFFRKEKPDIVHTHTPKAGLIGMLAAKLAKVPVRMHTVAGLPLMEATGIKRIILDNVERLTSWAAHFVYPNSFAMRDFMDKEKLAQSKKLRVIAEGSSNGINTDYFSKKCRTKDWVTRSTLGIEADTIVYCFVGRIVNDKGIKELLLAFNKLMIINNNVKLLMVGGFEEELYPLDKLSKEIIITNKNIISVGFQRDVRQYLDLSDIFVFPSYREGFPNVVMQAGAMGLPSIVSDINGCNEIIVENKNGIIVPVKDKDTLFNKMQLLYSNSDMRGEMANNSREMVINRYSQSYVWNEILNEYNRLINV